MEEKNPRKTTSHSKPSTDSDTSDEGAVNLRYNTSVEEKEHGTIPGSALATSIALNHSRAQASPTIERGPPPKTKIKNFLRIKQKRSPHRHHRRTKIQSNL